MISPQHLEAMLARVRPIPIVDTLGMRFVEIDEGRARITVPYDRKYDGIFHSFHGGLLMTVADSAACFAVLSLVDADEIMTTTDMNIRFLAPCLTDVTADARVIKLGRTLCPVAVDLFDAAGAKVAVAQVTYIRLDRMPSRPQSDT